MNELPDFIPGLKLSEMYYKEAVKPILEKYFPGLCYSVARLDYGSDVLGFDTPMSRDHGWGPRLMLFLSPEENDELEAQINEFLSKNLPHEFYGYSTSFTDLKTTDQLMKPVEQGAVNHFIEINTPEKFFLEYVGVNINEPLRSADWLVIPRQKLATIRSGKIFHDGLGALEPVKKQLEWYPHDLWLYLMANQWKRIDQEEPFMGRTGDTGDETGSQLVASHLVQDLMSLCFLMERQFAPYIKWFGTAFSRLRCAAELQPVLDDVLRAQSWKKREEHLSLAYLIVGRLNNELEITEHVQPEIRSFHSRPYQVPHSSRFAQALMAEIKSEEVKKLPSELGSVDQFVNSIDLLESMQVCLSLKSLYQN